MKIDVTTPILALDKTPLKDESNNDLLLANVMCDALSVELKTDENEKSENKYKRGKLAMKIYDARFSVKSTDKFVELEVEEAAQIKDRVSKVFGALIVVQVFDAIEKGK